MPNSQFSNRACSLYALFSHYSSCNIHKNCFLQVSPQSRAFTGMVFEGTRSTFYWEHPALPVIKIMISLSSWQVAGFHSDFFFTNFESKRLIQEMLYFVPTFFWETLFVLQHLSSREFYQRWRLGRGGGAEVTALTHPQNGRYSGWFFLIKTGLLFISNKTTNSRLLAHGGTLCKQSCGTVLPGGSTIWFQTSWVKKKID